MIIVIGSADIPPLVQIQHKEKKKVKKNVLCDENS